MALLQFLPNELVDIILTHLESCDASSLSLTCKDVHAAASPAAYQSIILEWRSAAREKGGLPKVPQIHALLRTLIRKPEYIKRIKKLVLQATDLCFYQDNGSVLWNMPSGNFKIENEEIKMFEGVIDRLQVSEPGFWKSVIRQKDDFTVYQMLVVRLCTHLESLSVAIDFEMQTGWFATLVEEAIATVTASANDSPSWYNKLSDVHITGDVKGYIWGQEFLLLKRTSMLLFYLPNLETLELTAFVDPEENTGLNWKDAPPPQWPLRQYPNAEKLTALRLVRSSINPGTIELLLLQTPNLTTLEYDAFSGFDIPLDLSGVRDALRHVRNTLTNLVIRYEMYQEDEDFHPQSLNQVTVGSLGPLRDFPALTSLSVSLAVLFGSDTVTMGQTPKLADVLPPRLQRLTITDDLWMFNDFQQYFEDVDAMNIFRVYMAGQTVAGNWRGTAGYRRGGDNWTQGLQYSNIVWKAVGEPAWKVATPELKRFVYDLRTWGHMSFGYWNDPRSREELIGVCQAQGIECEVLFEEDD